VNQSKLDQLIPLDPSAVNQKGVAIVEILGVIVATVVFVGPFVALSILAVAYGVDSRPSIGDDRSVGNPRWI
jgi:hypothetical protein